MLLESLFCEMWKRWNLSIWMCTLHVAMYIVKKISHHDDGWWQQTTTDIIIWHWHHTVRTTVLKTSRKCFDHIFIKFWDFLPLWPTLQPRYRNIRDWQPTGNLSQTLDCSFKWFILIRRLTTSLELSFLHHRIPLLRLWNELSLSPTNEQSQCYPCEEVYFCSISMCIWWIFANGLIASKRPIVKLCENELKMHSVIRWDLCWPKEFLLYTYLYWVQNRIAIWRLDESFCTGSRWNGLR